MSAVSQGLRRPAAAVSLTFLVVLVAAVAAAPLVAPAGPLEQDLRHVFEPPTSAHPLGTDALGRDILSRLLHGGRVSLIGALQAVAVMLTLGVPLGLAAGFRGGRVDRAVRFGCDVALAIPVIVVLLAVLATFEQDLTAAMVTFGLLGVPGMARVVRGVALAVRAEPYIAAARVAGLGALRIVLRHVLPRVAGPIVVQTSLFAGMAIITESGLAFLGLGVQEPHPSWGGMVAAASNVISEHGWLLVPPGVVIGLTVLAFGVLGDVVRDAIAGTPPSRRRGGPASPAAPSGAPARSPGALLQVRGLTVELPGADGPATVVRDVALHVSPGETVGLVGESGCGKTITARAILGLLPPGGRIAGGSCVLDGVELTSLPAHELAARRGSEIALISQEPIAGLDPSFRAGDQVAEVVRRHHRCSRAAARARAIELLRLVRIADPERVARLHPHQLSGGMAQRVGIAAALAGSPRLLIADEPTTALDVTVQAEILALLRDLQRETGLAILLVTHDWGVVADLCDRAIVMYAGEVVEDTAVETMFRRPLHPYTDALMRCNPAAGDAHEPLPWIPGQVPAPGRWPQGCHFHPRCPLATADCRVRPIELEPVAPGHRARCIHHDELLVTGR